MNNTQLAVLQPSELVRQSTDIAGLCKEIVIKSAMEIQGRKYVKVEGWQSIATAHGCIASSRDVERIDGGYRAIGEVRRMSDGAVLATAEGFVGEDESTWWGGEQEVWDKVQKRRVTKMLPKRPDYAIRAMAQTRAISRACRSAFAHVVVLMDAGLSTTPAEEVPHGGFHDDAAITERQEQRDNASRTAAKEQQDARQRGETSETATGIMDWKTVKVHFGKANGKMKGKALGELNDGMIDWLHENYRAKEEGDPNGEKLSKEDRTLKAAVAMAIGSRKSKGKPPVAGNDDDNLPMFNGPNHEKLAGLLAAAKIETSIFIEVAKANKWVPVDAKHFGSISDETAAKFVGDFETVEAAVLAAGGAK